MSWLNICINMEKLTFLIYYLPIQEYESYEQLVTLYYYDHLLLMGLCCQLSSGREYFSGTFYITKL